MARGRGEKELGVLTARRSREPGVGSPSPDSRGEEPDKPGPGDSVPVSSRRVHDIQDKSQHTEDGSH